MFLNERKPEILGQGRFRGKGCGRIGVGRLSEGLVIGVAAYILIYNPYQRVVALVRIRRALKETNPGERGIHRLLKHCEYTST